MDILNTIVIDRVMRGAMQSRTTSELLWTINQIEGLSITGSADASEVVDYLGTPIATLNRAKRAEADGTNALFDFGLAAAQVGTEREISSASNVFTVTFFDEIEITAEQKTSGTVTLAHVPYDVGSVDGSGLPFIYKLTDDGLAGAKYAYASAASASAFTYDGKELTFPTALVAGDRILAVYEYQANGTDEAMQILNSAENFPNEGKFTFECMFRDTCNSDTVYYGYIEFPKAKLDANFDWSFTTDGKHAFKIIAQQDYCSKKKTLCRILIPELVEAA